MQLNERLYELRRAHNLSQEALANKLGVSRQAVSKWERGETAPDTWNLIALSELYGVSLDQIVRGKEATEDGCAQDVPEVQAQDEPQEAGEGASEQPEAEAAQAAEPAQDAEAAGSAQDAETADPAQDAPKKDFVNINWRDGINVHDKHGAKVHVGWDGVSVFDPKEHAHVTVNGAGVNVADKHGTHVVTNQDGSVEVEGQHYDNWKDAHDAFRKEGHGSKAAAAVTAVYVIGAAICALVLGVCAGQVTWAIDALITIPAVACLIALIDACAAGKAAHKKRNKLTDFVGWTGICIFFALGVTYGIWHPAWVAVAIAFLICWAIHFIWRVDKE